jgi:hypothetical protein
VIWKSINVGAEYKFDTGGGRLDPQIQIAGAGDGRGQGLAQFPQHGAGFLVPGFLAVTEGRRRHPERGLVQMHEGGVGGVEHEAAVGLAAQQDLGHGLLRVVSSFQGTEQAAHRLFPHEGHRDQGREHAQEGRVAPALRRGRRLGPRRGRDLSGEAGGGLRRGGGGLGSGTRPVLGAAAVAAAGFATRLPGAGAVAAGATRTGIGTGFCVAGWATGWAGAADAGPPGVTLGVPAGAVATGAGT